LSSARFRWLWRFDGRLFAGVQSRGVVRRVPEVPGVPDDAAGLRAANARLRELLAERDKRIAGQDAEIAVLR